MSVRFTNAGSYTVAAALPGSQLHTLCCWVQSANVGGSGADGNVLHLDNGTDSDSSRIGVVDVSGTYDAVFVQHRTGVGSTAFLGPITPANGWHHLALVIDGTNQISYVDGVVVDTRAFNPTLRTTAFTIARLGNQLNPPQDQTQQDAMIFTSALTATEILTVMRGRIPKTQVTSLFGWWPMHGDSPTFDYSGHGRTLSTTGGTPVAGLTFAPASWSASQQRAMRVFLNSSGAIAGPGGVIRGGASQPGALGSGGDIRGGSSGGGAAGTGGDIRGGSSAAGATGIGGDIRGGSSGGGAQASGGVIRGGSSAPSGALGSGGDIRGGSAGGGATASPGGDIRGGAAGGGAAGSGGVVRGGLASVGAIGLGGTVRGGSASPSGATGSGGVVRGGTAQLGLLASGGVIRGGQAGGGAAAIGGVIRGGSATPTAVGPSPGGGPGGYRNSRRWQGAEYGRRRIRR